MNARFAGLGFMILLALPMFGCEPDATRPHVDEREDDPIVPLVSLPATFRGDLKLISSIEGEWAHYCTAPASFTLTDGEESSSALTEASGTLEIEAYTFADNWRLCVDWFPQTRGGTITGFWRTPDSLRFHIDLDCGNSCLRTFHEEDEDRWQAYVSPDTMHFVGSAYEQYRLEFEGAR